MNERIKDLVKAAGGIGHDDDGTELTPALVGKSLEKFAELIVKEMCQVMKAEGEQFSLDQNFDAVKGVGRCMRKVKQHFGVEDV